MATSKDEMKALIRKMAETNASVEWFRVRNGELEKALHSITVAGPKYGGVGGRSGTGDPVGNMVIDRERVEEEIKLNKRIISARLSHHAKLSAVMEAVLTKDERAVIWAKHGDGLPWYRVERMVKMSRSSCIRTENKGMEKLCMAWDKENKE